MRPHPGPQARFLASTADIAIYGGAAGGGKSFALLLDPLRYVHVPGFQAAIFRRTTEQTRQSGGLWDESCGLYSAVGGVGREHTLDWRWPGGGTIRFEQLQHEQTKHEYQGAQIAYLAFDELTHFSESQFFYMLSRNRSVCGVKPQIRATTNPDATSWVAKFISWWIDPSTGLPIPERSGVKRWFVRVSEEIVWSDEPGTLIDKYPGCAPKSVTFIFANLSDNKTLEKNDPSYRANLLALPRIERERLLGGNWRVSTEAVICGSDLRTYAMSGDQYLVEYRGQKLALHPSQARRFGTVDTAGTSREKAEEIKGRDPSWSVCGIWDYFQAFDLLILRHVWRDRVGWLDLKAAIATTLRDHNCPRVLIENAHHGQALASELVGFAAELIGPVLPGMSESHRGAKLERAIASGLLSRIEAHKLFIPVDERSWVKAYRSELESWTGLPDAAADQIDISSYASHNCRSTVTTWGGTFTTGRLSR